MGRGWKLFRRGLSEQNELGVKAAVLFISVPKEKVEAREVERETRGEDTKHFPDFFSEVLIC